MAFVSISAQMSLWSHRGHAKARDHSTACGCSMAAHAALVCSRLLVSKQCETSLRSSASCIRTLACYRAHCSNKIARVFSLLKASDCVPVPSHAGRFPWVQQQQSWALLLHKPLVTSALEIASLTRVQVHGAAGAVLANQAPFTFTVHSLFYRLM